MVGELVRSSIESPRRTRIEIHANTESDRVQWRGEMKRCKSGAWNREGEEVCRMGGNRSSDVRTRAPRSVNESRATDLASPTAYPCKTGGTCEHVRRTCHQARTRRR